jgi:hypothetical protein
MFEALLFAVRSRDPKSYVNEVFNEVLLGKALAVSLFKTSYVNSTVVLSGVVNSVKLELSSYSYERLLESSRFVYKPTKGNAIETATVQSRFSTLSITASVLTEYVIKRAK